MPNLAILVFSLAPLEGGGVGLHFASFTADGFAADGDIDGLDFEANIPATNGAIIAAAKAAQAAQNGVTFQPSDKMLLFGGRVSN